MSEYDTLRRIRVLSKQNTIKANVSSIPSASETQKGIIRIATEQEVADGILNNVAITPLALKNITSFEFEQAIASDTWVIEHNLNKRPSVVAVDTAGRMQLPDEIVYDSDNQVTIQFISAFAGKAYLN